MTTLNFRDLMSISIDRVVRPVRRFILDRKLDRHYVNRQFFSEQVKDSQRNLQWTDKQIAILESDRRRV